MQLPVQFKSVRLYPEHCFLNPALLLVLHIITQNAEDKVSTKKSSLSSYGSEVAALIENGMEFLEKARKEYEAKEYKYSVVSFSTAVEILLKVPLVSEHWTLVCSGRSVSRRKYSEGDFQSVSFDDICIRLRDILEKPLSPETVKVFNSIRNHRNRVVHFFHSSFSDSMAESILAQQAQAWFALNRLISEDWKQYFHQVTHLRLNFHERRLLQGNEFYAEARLQHIKPELDKYAHDGAEIQECNVCHKCALITEKELTGDDGPTVYKQHCVVCSHKDHIVRLNCPDCESALIIRSEEAAEDVSCSVCDAEHSRYDLLDEATYHSVDEMMDSIVPADCGECDGEGTVCIFADKFLCTRCLDIHQGFDECGICGSPLEAMGESLKYSGCAYCDYETIED